MFYWIFVTSTRLFNRSDTATQENIMENKTRSAISIPPLIWSDSEQNIYDLRELYAGAIALPWGLLCRFRRKMRKHVSSLTLSESIAKQFFCVHCERSGKCPPRQSQLVTPADRNRSEQSKFD